MTNTRTRTSLLGAAASAAAEAVADALAAAEARSAAKAGSGRAVAAAAPGPAVAAVATASSGVSSAARAAPAAGGGGKGAARAGQPGMVLGLLSRESGETLIDQIVRSVAARIDDRLLRGGARMPSIRAFAAAHGVSAFTVVAGYDKLVASGYLESRRGAGFFVREPAAMELNLAQRRPGGRRRTGEAERDHPGVKPIDVVWLVRNMFRQMPHGQMPGTGVLPPDWMDGVAIGNALRAVSRQNANLLIGYGVPQGFLPLRQQLQLKFAEMEIAAAPEQIVTTAGVTQALDLVAREFTRPGDTIFVDDPAWFLMFGSFAALGAKVVGIPRLADGPDIAQLAELAALHKPKLYIINSVLHNPSSTSLSAAKAFQVLRLAEEHDFVIVEDDIYCDLHPGAAVQPATRLAALDQLQRVIYLGGFSKTMAANLRVGFIATSPERAERLADRKMLTMLTTSDIGERVVYKVLSEGSFRKHIDRVRARLDGIRAKTIRQMERVGLKVDVVAPAGMFVWVDAGCDTNVLTEKAMAHNMLLAPGSLFSPKQLPSTRMRVNVAAMQEPAVWRFLERELGRS
ncbi:PLP-dependent aminotransferase family protein [Duganella sp. BJB488]|uniref:aminotransferase-like domain-containing protein n=1 Tax=unclassified Duganella TaxID=2636909 RepID=UPI000E355C50|nr:MULTISPECIES: PLP-dependent aminotransferase family protein [unclassified Duganella]RFP20254.1 PLP-dependent aminotransferase family protein [Duganella sp. BJB489]RFP21299.1 PLP-dependent aminotransferase family protein [Duganella sp. BJB488]RFP33441.1 PLP-dependent aminotransferase family protein [Duganella sp. BJB480]